MSWHRVGGSLRLHVGTRVLSKADPRLGEGRVEAVHNSSLVKVKWLETGWLSWLPIDDVESIKRGEMS